MNFQAKTINKALQALDTCEAWIFQYFDTQS